MIRDSFKKSRSVGFIKRIIYNFQKLRLNVFDYFVIFSVFVIVSSFLIIRLLLKDTVWVTIGLNIGNDEWWWQGYPPQYWLIDDLYVGQESYNSFRKKVAEIKNVYYFETGGINRSTFLEIKLLASYDKRTKTYTFKFQPLQIGKPLDMTFEKNNVRGLVTYIGDDNMNFQERVLEVKRYSELPWESVAYKVGDQMKDNQGNVLAEILEVQTEPSKNYEFYDSVGRRFVIPGYDKERLDTSIKIKIRTFKIGEIEYFVNGMQVKVGEDLWVQFPQSVIKGAKVIKIYEN